MLLSTCQALQAMEEASNQGGEGQRRGFFCLGPWQLVSLAKRQRMMRSVEAGLKYVCIDGHILF